MTNESWWPKWQICPVCNGRGTVPANFYEARVILDHDLICRTCNGSTMVERPEASES